jgi:hypothetical protein
MPNQQVPWHTAAKGSSAPKLSGPGDPTNMTILASQKTIIGVFKTKSDNSIVLADPSTYTESIASQTGPTAATVNLTTCPPLPANADGSPGGVVISDGAGNSHTVVAGDACWILDAVPDGSDLEIAFAGFSFTMGNLELTTATAPPVTDVSGAPGVGQLPVGI